MIVYIHMYSDQSDPMDEGESGRFGHVGIPEIRVPPYLRLQRGVGSTKIKIDIGCSAMRCRAY